MMLQMISMMLQIDIEIHLAVMSIFCKNALYPDKIASKYTLFPILTAQGSTHSPQCWKHTNGIAKRQSPYLRLFLHTTYTEIISRTEHLH